MTKKRIDLNSLPSNNRSGPNSPDRITKGTIRTKRRAEGTSSHVANMATDIFETILLPAIKNIVGDVVQSTIQTILWGESSPRRSTQSGRIVDYSRFSRPSTTRPRRAYRSVGEVLELDTLYFDDRLDAEAVLGRMLELVAEYGWVTVGDLYSLVGMTATANHERDGWSKLSSARIVHRVDGYVLDLPEPSYAR